MLRSVAAAADIPGDQIADEELKATVYVCRTVDEWVTAVRERPEAMGLKGPEFVDPVIDMATISFHEREAPACLDGVARSLDRHWK
ncbi:hypothetical protein [Microbacterium album]|uniref:Uncharacterized protein n=1 Tax=Microbacterium album TaxID=2053191 RepID=A0A917IEI6_9MICO|nr:hypothetical protein [Microbacterium album]GGH44919.1 hypothetical protein GCM10010921_19940 [Microbacterium album]